MSKTAEKIMILGVDAMDPRLTRKFMKKGSMPNMEKFIKRGACRDDLVLLGGHPTVTPAMWTTLACGCYANVHGITAFYRQAHGKTLDTVEYNFDSRNCTAQPLWEKFAEAGKKTLVWHWPGSSWPPTTDNENLWVVDGTSPGTVGMATSTVESEFIMTAKDTYDTTTIILGAANEAVAPCVVEGMDVSSDGMTLDSWTAKYITRIVTSPEQLENASTENGLPLHVSPFKMADDKWANAPKDAKDFTLLCSNGLLQYYGLALKDNNGKYTKVALYKSKKDAEPFVILEPGVLMTDVYMEAYKGDKKIPVTRNLKLLNLDSEGTEMVLYVSSAMNPHDDSVWSPKWLHDEILNNVGPVKPTSYIGCQSKTFITECMLANWDVVGDWQAKSILHLIENQGVEIVFSHFHNVDIQFHKFVKHLCEGKEFNRLPHEDYEKFAEDVYKQTDNYLGKFYHLLDEGWSIMIVSDHAQVSPKHDCQVLGETCGVSAGIMKDLGFTALKKDENGNELEEIDWEHTKAIAVRECNIYLNLKGRDSTGIVDPKDQYELEEDIITALYGYHDPKTGHRVVSVALRNRDAVLLGYGGPECGDICFWMAEGYNADHDDCLSTTLGESETSVSPIFVAAGKGFKENFKTDRIIRQIDVAATMAVLGGVKMPAQCEGAPVYQIMTGQDM